MQDDESPENGMHILRAAFGIAFLALCFTTGTACAAPGDTPVLSDREIDARMNSLAQSLQAERTSAEYWEYGWGAFDGGTMLWSAAEAAGEHDRKDRSTDIVQAAESLIGLADVVFRPLPAFSADALCQDPVLTRQEMLQCLEAREALLERSAERANEPYEFLPHFGNFAFNALAGLLVEKIADTRHALITAIPGEIIGEIQLETTPSQPLADREQYQLQFGPLRATEGSQVPATGVMATLRF